VLASTFAHAQLTVEVSGAGSNRVPVAVAAFEGESALPRAVTDVVRADLERSGLFKLVELGPTPMGADAPDYARVRSAAPTRSRWAPSRRPAAAATRCWCA
jgi:TolB protein